MLGIPSAVQGIAFDKRILCVLKMTHRFLNGVGAYILSDGGAKWFRLEFSRAGSLHVSGFVREARDQGPNSVHPSSSRVTVVAAIPARSADAFQQRWALPDGSQ